MQEADTERQKAADTLAAHEDTQRALTEAHVRIAVLEDAAQFATVKQDGTDKEARSAQQHVTSLQEENEGLKHRVVQLHDELRKVRLHQLVPGRTVSNAVMQH